MQPNLEQLVIDFYGPRDVNSFKDLSAVNAELQKVTDSPQGWAWGAGLLNSTHKDARFHGALVFTIKLHHEGASTPPEQLVEIRDHLVAAFVRLVVHGEEYRNIQKLAAALVSLLIAPGTDWDHAVHHLIWSLSLGKVQPYEEIQSSPSVSQLQISQLSLAALTIFANTLAQDANKINHATPRSAHLPERLRKNFDAISTVIDRALLLAENRPDDASNSMLRNHGSRAMECFSSWITYAKGQLSGHDTFMDSLRLTLNLAFRLLLTPTLFNNVTVFFSDVMTSHPGFLMPDQVNNFVHLLQSDWAATYLRRLEAGEDPDEESISFAVLAFAFGQYLVPTLVQESDASNRYLELLHRLTRAQTIQTVEEELSNDVVDFWEEFVVAMEDTSAPEFAQKHWLRAVESLIYTSCLPFSDSDPREFEQFCLDDPYSDYRSRISNLIEDSFENVGPIVLKKIISMALEVHANANDGQAHGTSPQDTVVASKNGSRSGHTDMNGNTKTSASQLSLRARQQMWSMLESVLRNLQQLSHAREYREQDEEEDSTLHHLFNSAMFQELLSMDLDVPRKLHIIAFQLIGSFSDYFGNHPDMMLSALQTLFRHLPNSMYSTSAARAIHLLCDKNRQKLTSQIGDFMTFTGDFMSKPQHPDTIKRVLGADAAIVQAAKDDIKILHLGRLLQYVEQEYARSVPVPDELSPAAQAFQYLVEIAEYSLSPRSTPIDLDAPDIQLNFWGQGPGREFQLAALRFAGNLIAAAPMDGAALDNACQFIRTGLNEANSGPFVFSPIDVVPVLAQFNADNPRFDAVFHLATSLVESKQWQRKSSSTATLLEMTRLAIGHFQTPDKEPDVAFRMLQLLATIFERDFGTVLQIPPQHLEQFMAFGLSALRSQELLPKREACRFWSFLSKVDTREPYLQEQAAQIIRLVGSTLVAELLNNIATTSKSELEYFSEPLHKLVRNMPDTKTWIQSTLSSPSFPGDRASVAAKETFVRMFTQPQLRRRQVLEFTKEFWSACRGVPITYG